MSARLIAPLLLSTACSGTAAVSFPREAPEAGSTGPSTPGIVTTGSSGGGGVVAPTNGSSGSNGSSSGAAASGSGSSSGALASGSSGSSSGALASNSSGSSSGTIASGSSSSGGSSPVPTTGVCANNGTRILTSSQPDAFIDNFEEAKISPGWSSFNDVSPIPNVFSILQVIGGAAGTAHSGEYAGAGATTTAMGGYGVGTVYNTAIDVSAGVYCVDISAFTGVSFWAKAGTAGSKMSLNFVVPSANLFKANDAGVPTEGDCQANCYDFPRISFTLTTAWAHYTAAFAQAAGGSVAVGNVIQELEWLSPDSNWDFSLDEIAFYAGTPPTGAVGPNPN